MATVVTCSAHTERQAQSILEEVQFMGYDCFEERIQEDEFLISTRLHCPSEKALIVETLEKAGGEEIATWEEQAA